MNKDILLVIATHGNEKIGPQVVEELTKKKLDNFFDVLIANTQAYQKNVRFIEADLNRSYPGDKNSKLYEERLAVKNLAIAKKYKYIIDIHEASQGTDDFVIVPRKKISDRFPLQFINLNKVLLWPDPKGPLSQILPQAIELEFGTKNRDRKKLIDKASRITMDFIKLVSDKKLISKFWEKKRIYYVYDKLKGKESLIKTLDLKDFIKIKIAGEEFYPLLTGQYLRFDIVCYKMKKIN